MTQETKYLTYEIKNYYKELTDTAEQILADLEVKSIQDYEAHCDGIYELIYEDADSACTDSYDCDKILKTSDHDTAYEDVGIELTGSLQDVKRAMAFWAYHRDLMEAVEEIASNLPDAEE